MTISTIKSLRALALGAALAALPVSMAAAAGGGDGHHIERQKWSFGGFFGHYDKAQLQRGWQVYQEVCAACHGLKRVNFRNLVQPGGPGFPEASVKALAAGWANKIPDMTESGESAVVDKDKDGKIKGFKYVTRTPLLSDPILGPYKNEAEARSAQNGALPPDLSVIAKARNVENEAPWYIHVFLMARDILTSYQEGGSDYLYALLTGYQDKAPAGKKNSDGTPFVLGDGMYFNHSFPGNQIAMAPPLSDGAVTYQDGTPSKVENYARDVSAFLAWTADPSLDQRKRMGWQVMLYLLITTVLLYLAKRRLWASAH